MRKLAIVFLSLVLLAMVSAVPVYAQVPPGMPHAFYGSVDINGSPAPEGTEVSATVDTGSIIEGIELQNPVTTEGGSYGITSPRLLVQGDIPSGAIITFHVTNADGTAIADVTATFVAGGGPDEKNLSVTITEPSGPSGGGAAPSSPEIETTIFGIEESFSISDDGELLETVEATSDDGMLTITILEGTIALDIEGEPLDTLETAVDETPPDPPEDAHIIGLAYDFGPDGATFDPPIKFTWSYDPNDIPEGVAEEDLVVAYYDEATGEWVELDGVVDTENNTITASVAHFTTFAIIGVVAPPEEEEVAPPEEEVVPPEEEVAPPEEEVTPPEEEVVPPEEEVTPTAPPGINWPMVGGIIGGVIVVGLGIFFFVRRRAY